ncbi:MAG: hypothetical protein KC421_05775, partial [Anaerolineales bacterium]|nr:hypothetical protein [Anaerolineales bacterium]
MLVELWGASNVLGLTLPGTPLGYIFLLIETVLLIGAIFLLSSIFSARFMQKWQWTVSLSIAGLITSQLSPIFFSFTDQPLTPFSVFPLLLAAALLDPLSVVIVGLFTGLGMALGQTHTLFDLIHFAFTGLIAFSLMQQRYIGRVYQLMRQPILTGGISMIAAAFLQGIGAFFNATPNAFLARLDHALYQSQNAFYPFLAAGLIGGILLFATLKGMPNLHPKQTLIPSPARRSLRKQLITNFSAFSLFLTILLVTVVFNLSVSVSR